MEHTSKPHSNYSGPDPSFSLGLWTQESIRKKHACLPLRTWTFGSVSPSREQLDCIYEPRLLKLCQHAYKESSQARSQNAKQPHCFSIRKQQLRDSSDAKVPKTTRKSKSIILIVKNPHIPTSSGSGCLAV